MLNVKTGLILGGLLLALFTGGGAVTAAPAGVAYGTTYVVQPGDSLSSIALYTYGNAGAWGCIWNANAWIGNPSYLQAGWRIALPGSCSMGGGGPVYGGSGAYIVRPGDTLSGISVWAYGTPNGWGCLWNANSWIGSPNYLVPGWRLTIPANCAASNGYPPMGGRYHVVMSAETLSGIACAYYADCNYWRIYNANRGKIWNSDYLLPGTVLYIP